MAQKTHPLVEVVWDDAHSPGGNAWSAWDADMQKKMSMIQPSKSVGYVLYDTPKLLALASSIGFDPDGDIDMISGDLVIPRRMVKKIRRL